MRKLRLLLNDVNWNLIVPCANNMHWGAVVVVNKNIWGADSLSPQNFSGIYSNASKIKEEIMVEFFPSSKWDVESKHYVIDHLGWTVKND